MIQFETISGSKYEVDREGKRIRRLSGERPPQPRQGADGDWKTYEDISPVEVGDQVVIVWPKATTPLLEGSPEGATPSTFTSPVVRVAVRTEKNA